MKAIVTLVLDLTDAAAATLPRGPLVIDPVGSRLALEVVRMNAAAEPLPAKAT